MVSNSNNLTGKGNDYNSGPYYVTFPAGEVNVSFNITIIINDVVLEDNETFNLTIKEVSLPENVTLGKIDITQVTIVNNGGSGKCAVKTARLHMTYVKRIAILHI